MRITVLVILLQAARQHAAGNITVIFLSRLDVMITHRFPFAVFMRAYEVCSNAGKEKALKVIIDNS